MMKTVRKLSQRRFILVTVIVMAASTSVSAAPLCAGVLTTAVISQADIDRTIENIARLRLDLDLQKSSGNQGARKPSRLSERIYQTKYTELISALKATHSEKEIRELISQEISLLQKDLNKEILSEKDARAAQREEQNIYAALYTRTDRIVLERKLIEDEQDGIEYVPKLNSLLISTETLDSRYYDKSISLLNLETKQQTVLWQTGDGSNLVMTKYSSDHKFFTALVTGADTKGELFFYDIQNATHRMIKIPPEANYEPSNKISGLDVNPSGQSILLILRSRIGTNARALMIDTQTGKATLLPDLAKKVEGDRQIQFYSQDKFVFLETQSNGWDNLGVYNLANQTETPILHRLMIFKSMHISRDLQQLYFVSMHAGTSWIIEPGIKTLATEHLYDAKANLITHDQGHIGNNPSKIKPLPNAGLFVRHFVSKARNELMQTFDDSVVPVNLIQDTSSDVSVADVAVDTKGHRLFIYSKDNHSKQTDERFIDIWTQKPTQ